MHKMVQKGALWPSAMTRFGPWANNINAFALKI